MEQREEQNPQASLDGELQQMAVAVVRYGGSHPWSQCSSSRRLDFDQALLSDLDEVQARHWIDSDRLPRHACSSSARSELLVRHPCSDSEVVDDAVFAAVIVEIGQFVEVEVERESAGLVSSYWPSSAEVEGCGGCSTVVVSASSGRFLWRFPGERIARCSTLDCRWRHCPK